MVCRHKSIGPGIFFQGWQKAGKSDNQGDADTDDAARICRDRPEKTPGAGLSFGDSRALDAVSPLAC
ncbi:MAG TPA: hypothetical protein DCZ13_01925 [Porticoccaceae bacterium]|nr:hypothetical protein [Porticoccaceae bacterium]